MTVFPQPKVISSLEESRMTLFPVEIIRKVSCGFAVNFHKDKAKIYSTGTGIYAIFSLKS